MFSVYAPRTKGPISCQDICLSKEKNVSRFEKPVVPLSQLRPDILVGSRAEKVLAPNVEK